MVSIFDVEPLPVLLRARPVRFWVSFFYEIPGGCRFHGKIVRCFCDTSLNSPLSWPPPSLVPLLSASVPCCAIVDTAPLIARPPAAVPGAGCAAPPRLACQPPRPCPEARPRAPQLPSPVSAYLTEIDCVRIPLRPSAPPRHPAPASMSVGRHRARGFPPGQSLSPPIGAVTPPPMESRLSA